VELVDHFGISLKSRRMLGQEVSQRGMDEKIPVQVPAIETCFMSIDEIAQIFYKSHSLYRGGDSMSQTPKYIGGEIGIFLSLRNMKKI